MVYGLLFAVLAVGVSSTKFMFDNTNALFDLIMSECQCTFATEIINTHKTMATYTFKTGMTVTQDWDRDGYLVIENAKTLKLYHELNDKASRYDDPCMFYAFSQEQFDRGMEKVKPHLKEGQEVLRYRYGLFSTKEAYDKLIDFLTHKDEIIAKECDPQEVYCYEYNNYESCIAWEGDKEPYEIVKRIYGPDVKIHRF